MADQCKCLKRSGERGGNRTYNLLIKSQLLCQLSYAPERDSLARASVPPEDQARRMRSQIPLGFLYPLKGAMLRHQTICICFQPTTKWCAFCVTPALCARATSFIPT